MGKRCAPPAGRVQGNSVRDRLQKGGRSTHWGDQNNELPQPLKVPRLSSIAKTASIRASWGPSWMPFLQKLSPGDPHGGNVCKNYPLLTLMEASLQEILSRGLSWKQFLQEFLRRVERAVLLPARCAENVRHN